MKDLFAQSPYVENQNYGGKIHKKTLNKFYYFKVRDYSWGL